VKPVAYGMILGGPLQQLGSFRKNAPAGRHSFDSGILPKSGMRTFSATPERLQGKERLHGLAPETRLIAAQPIDEFIVEVRPTQVAEGDIARGAVGADAADGRQNVGAVCISE
jgi:hypothetical protein